MKQIGNTSEIKTEANVINTPTELAETFNLHFLNIGRHFGAEIPNALEFYMEPIQHSFSLTAPTADIVSKLLERINVRKPAGLDGMSNKLLKFAAHIVAPLVS